MEKNTIVLTNIKRRRVNMRKTSSFHWKPGRRVTLATSCNAVFEAAPPQQPFLIGRGVCTRMCMCVCLVMKAPGSQLIGGSHCARGTQEVWESKKPSAAYSKIQYERCSNMK